MVFVAYEGAWFSAGGRRQGERSGKMPVIDAAVGDEYNYPDGILIVLPTP